jgi:hypothetical protein
LASISVLALYTADQQFSTRTANYILLTDCAFLFFKGVPVRVWDPEIECDLSCLEEVFDAAHPFTHPSFSFSRHVTAQQAFSALFTTRQQGCLTTLTMLDSFVLIHSKLPMWTEEAQAPDDELTISVTLQCSTALSIRFSRYR